VNAYDDGMVEVDGIPINVEPTFEQGHGWLGAAEVITTTSTSSARTQRPGVSSTEPRASPGHRRHRISHVPHRARLCLAEEIPDARLIGLTRRITMTDLIPGGKP
jgi:hypothetical protein